MSKERLEEIKEKVVVEKVYVKQLNTRNNGYWTKSYLVLKDDWNWLIEQAELSGHFVQKNGELNEFLNKYCEATHWGRNVIDVAIDIIKNQAERVQELENVNRVLKKANVGSERAKERLREWVDELEIENERYREALEEIASKRMTYADMFSAIRTAKEALEGESE